MTSARQPSALIYARDTPPFIPTVRAALYAEVERSQIASRARGERPGTLTRRCMILKGTAGKAIELFDAEAAAHPDAEPAELVEFFAEALDAEVLSHHPRWYTVAHFTRLLEVAGKLAEARE